MPGAHSAGKTRSKVLVGTHLVYSKTAGPVQSSCSNLKGAAEQQIQGLHCRRPPHPTATNDLTVLPSKTVQWPSLVSPHWHISGHQEAGRSQINTPLPLPYMLTSPSATQRVTRTSGSLSLDTGPAFIQCMCHQAGGAVTQQLGKGLLGS